MDKLEDDWKGLKFWFLKTCEPNSLSEFVFVVYKVWYNTWETRLTNWRGWVGSALWVVGRGSCVVRRASCVIAHASLTRLLLVGFKDTVFLYTTLRIHEKVSPIKISKANLWAKYVLPGPHPFSIMFLAHCVLNEMHMRPRKPLPVKRKL